MDTQTFFKKADALAVIERFARTRLIRPWEAHTMKEKREAMQSAYFIHVIKREVAATHGEPFELIYFLGHEYEAMADKRFYAHGQDKVYELLKLGEEICSELIEELEAPEN